MIFVSTILGAVIGWGFAYFFGWWGLCFSIPICFVLGLVLK